MCDYYNKGKSGNFKYFYPELVKNGEIFEDKIKCNNKLNIQICNSFDIKYLKNSLILFIKDIHLLFAIL